MGIEKKKAEEKKRRILTKREKAHKRVLRVHKAVERKRKERSINKKKASNIRRKLQASHENEVVEMAEPTEHLGTATDTEMGLLQILGLTGHEGNHSDWDNLLEKKLKEVD